MRDTWVTLAITVLLPVFMYWIVSLDFRKRQQDNAVYAPLGMVIFLGGFGVIGLFGFGYMLLFLDVTGRNDFWAIVFLFLVCILFAFIGLDLYRRILLWDDYKLMLKRFWHSPIAQHWSDLAYVEQLPLTERYRLNFKDKTKFSFAFDIIGVDDFLRALRDHPNVELHFMLPPHLEDDD